MKNKNVMIEFINCTQKSQNVGGELSKQHLVWDLNFQITAGDRVYTGMTAQVIQPYGTNYEVDPFEVSVPTGSFPGIIPRSSFSEHAERYVRNFVGMSGNAIHLGPGAHAMMSNNTFSGPPYRFELEVEDGLDGAW